MADKQFIMDLAKLVIAAAWADGELTNEEVNALKDLLFMLPDLSGEEWLGLELYMDSQPSPQVGRGTGSHGGTEATRHRHPYQAHRSGWGGRAG